MGYSIFKAKYQSVNRGIPAEQKQDRMNIIYILLYKATRPQLLPTQQIAIYRDSHVDIETRKLLCHFPTRELLVNEGSIYSAKLAEILSHLRCLFPQPLSQLMNLLITYAYCIFRMNRMEFSAIMISQFHNQLYFTVTNCRYI